MDGKESYILSGSLGISSENISNEVISKMVLTHILKRWDESKTQFHLSFSAMTPPEHISLSFVPLL